MNQLKRLLEDRADLLNDFDAIIELAKKRVLSDTEKSKMEAIEKQVRVLNLEIEPLEAEEKISKQKAKKAMNQNNNYDDLSSLVDESGRVYLDKARSVSLIDSKTRLKNSTVKENLSLGELIVARIRGPINDVEKNALDTSLDTAGGISTKVSREFWDYARAHSTVVRAGAQTLDFEDGEHGNVVIPQITGSIAPEWKVQNVNVTLSDPTFTPRTLEFKTLMAGTKVSNELVQDSGSLLSKMIEHDLAQGFGSEIDRAALFGSGAGEEPLGVNLTPNINVFPMGTNGGDLVDFNPLVGAVRMLLDDNVPLERVSGFIMSPRTWEELAVLKEAVNLQQLNPPSQLSNIPYFVTSKIPINTTIGSSSDTSTIFAADWSKLVIGIRLSLKIRFSEHVFAQSYSTFISAVARVDFALINPTAFVAIRGITPGPALT